MGYTVEASYVFSISFLILLSVTLLGFQVYREGVSYIQEETVTESRDAAEIFRNVTWAKELVTGKD